MRSRVLRPTLVATALSVGVSACAAIWGFQDATDLRDAGDASGGTVDSAGADGAGDAMGLASASGGTRAVADAGPDVMAIADARADADETSTSDASGGNVVDAPSDAGILGDASGADASSSCPGECVAAPPAVVAGWTGPLEIYEIDEAMIADAGDGGAEPIPSCGESNSAWTEALDLHSGPIAPPASCTCSCGTPTDGVCSAPSANYYSDTSCNTACPRASTPIGAACTALPQVAAGCDHFDLSATVEDAGVCAVDASSSVPPLTWQLSARLCAPAAAAAVGSCDAGTCVPAQDSIFEKTYCIVHSGFVPCPTTGYSVLRTAATPGGGYFGDASDGRGCSACGCSPPTGVTCDIDASTSNTLQFGGTCGPSTPYTGCGVGPSGVGAGPPTTTYVSAAATPSGGTCTGTPDGGAPLGSVTPTAPYTICCTP